MINVTLHSYETVQKKIYSSKTNTSSKRSPADYGTEKEGLFLEESL